MNYNPTRRALLLGSALIAAAASVPAFAQDKPVLRFSAVFSDKDIRADMTKMFAEGIKGDFTLEPYYGGTLFKQGTELVALQRGNLEMGNIAPQDISNQIPAWSVLTSAYLFRDAAHLRDLLQQRARRRVQEDGRGSARRAHPRARPISAPARSGLKPDKKINTPADMAGIKLRMPGGDAWQFLGTALGANPTPMAYAEVYTGLQTGAIDGQDNPLPNVQNMKFYEVMSQIVLTSHLVGFDLLTVAGTVWNAMARGKAGQYRRPPPTRPSTGAPSSIWRARRHWWRSSRRKGSRSTRPMSPPSAPMRSRSTSSPIWPRAGRKA